MTRFDLDTDRDTWRSELDRAEMYELAPEYDDIDSPAHECTEACAAFCAALDAAVWRRAS